MKTEEELRDLKANWQADPIWNIEDSEGFEEYQDELLAYRQKCEENWAKAAERRTKRSTKYNIDLAVDLIEMANRDPGVWGPRDMVTLAIAHSLLALVDSIQRMTETLENHP